MSASVNDTLIKSSRIAISFCERCACCTLYVCCSTYSFTHTLHHFFHHSSRNHYFRDRALYLTIKENRDFLHVENFKQPFSGLVQTLFQRTVSAGLYFPLEDIFLQSLLEVRESRKSHVHDHWVALAAGNLAGAVSGLVLNPLAAVKVSSVVYL